MKFNTLQEVLTDCIRDLYNAENQLVKALPKMAKGASSPELRAAFEEHLEQTEEHVARLERVAEDLGIKPKGKTCHAMKGLIEEGQEVLENSGDATAKDAALIGAAQKVEHYEIAAYGTARTFARILGEQSAAELLQQTLDEEGEADKKLTAIAESGLNQEAAEEDSGSDVNGSANGRSRGRRESVERDDDAEESEMMVGEDDASDAAAPSRRGQTANGQRRSGTSRSVAQRGR